MSSRRNTLWVGSLVFVLSGCAAKRDAPPPAAEAPSVPEAPSAEPSAPPPPPPPALAVVRGSVSYVERVALTPEAVVHVEVVRQGTGASPSRVVGKQTYQTPGQVPIAFAVPLDDLPDTEVDYVVQARITDGARVFSSSEAVPVLTRGHPSEGVSVRVSSSAGQRPPR